MSESEDKNNTLYKTMRISTKDPYYEEILERHKEAIEKDEDMYEDPKTEYFVFTAKYLLNRGTCCNSGCRHCPYK
jgi:hypothetical protein